jgi:hypothetical protein
MKKEVNKKKKGKKEKETDVGGEGVKNNKEKRSHQ